jgi:putative DNA-invertase from lambdoid prophage Rac
MREGVIVKTVINGMVFDGATKVPIQQAVRDRCVKPKVEADRRRDHK